DLLLQEPLHELLAHVVRLLPGSSGQLRDLLGDLLLLLQRDADRLDHVGEVAARIAEAGYAGTNARVEQVLDHDQGVTALLDRLVVEELGQAGKRLVLVPDGGRQGRRRSPPARSSRRPRRAPSSCRSATA